MEFKEGTFKAGDKQENSTRSSFEVATSTYNYEAYAKWQNEELPEVYNWDAKTKEYVYQTKSPINFIESTVKSDVKMSEDKIVYWFEKADCFTADKPLEPKKGSAICMENDKWIYVEDHRGEVVYLKSDGSPFTVDKIGKIDNKYTTVIPPSNVQYYKFTDKWELDEDTEFDLITTITSLIKFHTEQAIKDELWTLPVEGEGKFEGEYEQFRYNSRDEAVAYILSLADKTMAELIDMLK